MPRWIHRRNFSLLKCAFFVRCSLKEKEGSNRYLNFKPEIITIDWKKTALADALDQKTSVNDMVNKALETSRDMFRNLCEYMETHRELGRVTCTLQFTKGRFKTTIGERKILADMVVKNEFNLRLATFRQYVEKWEELRGNRNGLENYLLRDLQNLIKELDDNFRSLCSGFNFYDFSKQGPSGKLRTGNFENLDLTKNKDRKIRWFIIKTNKDLEKDLVVLYDRFKEHNGSIDRLLAKGEIKTEDDIEKINLEREEMRDITLKIKDDLADLQRNSRSEPKLSN